MILHLVDKPEPDKITGANVVEKHGEWITAGVKRLDEHTKAGASFTKSERSRVERQRRAHRGSPLPGQLAVLGVDVVTNPLAAG